MVILCSMIVTEIAISSVVTAMNFGVMNFVFQAVFALRDFTDTEINVSRKKIVLQLLRVIC